MNMNKVEDEVELLLEDGELRKVERLLKQLLVVDPNCLTAHFHLARVYRRTKEYKQALYHARRTLKLSPRESNAFLNLGLIYECMGRDNLAASYYKRELSRNPSSPETLWNIGRLYYRKHRWLQASKRLRRCFETGFSFKVDDTVSKLGFCYYKLHDQRAYLNVYTSFVQMFPNESWAIANLGCALLQAKDYRGAMLRLSRAKQLGIKNGVDVELAQAKKMLLKKPDTK